MSVEIRCLRCGRDTLDGDCYGCEADRLRARLASLLEIVEEGRGMKYPEAPYQKHSRTSRDAAFSIGSKGSQTLKEKVFEYITSCGSRGATDEEIQIALDMLANTERPRRRELEIANMIVDSGRTRKTRSGREAVVWRKTPHLDWNYCEKCGIASPLLWQTEFHFKDCEVLREPDYAETTAGIPERTLDNTRD